MTIALMTGAPPERDGFGLEQGFSYSRDHWTSRLPNADQWPPSIDGGPVRGKWPVLDRRGVFALEDVQSPDDAVHLYVAACVWDSGLSGRKVSRLARVLRDNPDAGQGHSPPSPPCVSTGRSPHTAPSTRVELTASSASDPDSSAKSCTSRAGTYPAGTTSP